MIKATFVSNLKIISPPSLWVNSIIKYYCNMFKDQFDQTKIRVLELQC